MIATQTEQLLSQSAALNYVKKLTGKRPAPSTWHRWRLKGVAGIKLETVLICGQYFTSIEKLNHFFAASSEAKAAFQSQVTREGIRRSKAKAERQAEELGL